MHGCIYAKSVVIKINKQFICNINATRFFDFSENAFCDNKSPSNGSPFICAKVHNVTKCFDFMEFQVL